MAPNPIVLSKANELYPELHFNFMTWIKGSCVPALVCAALLPLILSWSCELHKSKVGGEEEGQQTKVNGDSIVQHAAKELREMGSMSTKELVRCAPYRKDVLYSALFNVVATLLRTLWLLNIMGDFWLHQYRLNFGSTHGHRCSFTYGNHTLERCCQ